MTPVDMALVERTSQRVAAAFELKWWGADKKQGYLLSYLGYTQWKGAREYVTWAIEPTTGELFWVEVGEPEGGCRVFNDDEYITAEGGIVWVLYANPVHHEMMAHGLYRLGFDDAGVLEELNYPLSAHEKLQLQRSMPRQYWPLAWTQQNTTPGEST
jgi:hypothetical protein